MSGAFIVRPSARHQSTKLLKCCVCKPAAGGRHKKALNIGSPKVATEFDRMIAGDVSETVGYLISVVYPKLRKVDRKADGRPARGRVEAVQAQIGYSIDGIVSDDGS